MIEVKLSDVTGWVFPTEVKEVSLREYLEFCEVSLKMPEWFRAMRTTKDPVERDEIEKRLNDSVDMKVDLVEYWADVLCVFGRPIGASPQLTPFIIKGASVEVDGKRIKFALGIEEMRTLWEGVDGIDNIFVRHQIECIQNGKDKSVVGNENERYLFQYDGHTWGVDTPYMRNSKLVEYIEAKFWGDVLNDADKGYFGKALGKLVAVLVRRYDEKEERLEDVLVDSFTESNVANIEKYFSDLSMDIVIEIGFFLLRRAEGYRRSIKMPIESLRALRRLAGLIH
jgi:hypothetical protein